MHQDRCVDPETICEFLNGQHFTKLRSLTETFLIFFLRHVGKEMLVFSVPFAITPFLQKRCLWFTNTRLGKCPL